MSISNLSEHAEITQKDQSKRINLHAFTSLIALFKNNYGPNSHSKMLINNQNIKILKDGRSLIDNILFTHPVINIINQSVKQNHDILGDGVCGFIVFGGLVFKYGVEEGNFVKGSECILNDLTFLRKMINDDKIGFNFDEEMKRFLSVENESSKKENFEENINSENTIPCSKEQSNILYSLIYSFLNTKMSPFFSSHFSSLILRSFIKNSNLIEIIEKEGDIKESTVIDGLVLDHSGRHMNMPKYLENVVIVISNMSFEYEKTEINSEMYFKSINEREIMIASERKILDRKINKILELNKKVQKEGRKLILLTERGIDLYALDKLKNILCLRRVKRRNLERLIKLCGGKLITNEEDFKLESLGYAGKVFVQEEKDKSFTFITNTPFTGVKTILLYSSNKYEKERIKISIKSAFKILSNLRECPFYLNNGINNYKKWSKKLEENNGKRTAVSEALYEMYQIVGERVSDQVKCDSIKDSFITIDKMLFNAGTVASTLLLVDEIIKAGKSVKEEEQKMK